MRAVDCIRQTVNPRVLVEGPPLAIPYRLLQIRLKVASEDNPEPLGIIVAGRCEDIALSDH